MATLYSRRAMRQVEPGPRPLSWADIEREREQRELQQRSRMPSGLTFALVFAVVCGFAGGVALTLLATGA